MKNPYLYRIISPTLLAGAFSILAACSPEESVEQNSSSNISSTQASVSSKGSSSSQSNAKLSELNIDAAPVTMRRLTDVEYSNTVRDLLGTTSLFTEIIPADYLGDFNNLHLQISSSHMEGYYRAAMSLASEAVELAKTGERSVINCDLESVSCALTVINDFGLKAWRRPVEVDEFTRLMAFYESAQLESNDRAVSMQTLIRRILLSPNFIFRPEFDADLSSAVANNLSDYELASRLSYFLWSTMPDTQLFAKAASGTLNNDKVLKAEVARMLEDPKAEALIDNFAGPWLGFDDLDYNDIDEVLFPDVDDALVDAFKSESRSLIDYIVQNNRPVSDIVAADYTFLNGSLAAHYGVNGIDGDSMVMHQWGADAKRRGLLGHASFLMGQSYFFESPTTLPLKRGLFVVDRLLCDKPPEPPAAVVGLFPELPEGLNSRDLLEMSVSVSPICNGCHIVMDAVGYGLENFDPVGRWRESYPNGDVVDASADLFIGESFTGIVGPVELSRALSIDPQIPFCAIQYGMSYALGRRLNTFHSTRLTTPASQDRASDYEAVYSVYKNTESTGHGMRDIITEIVLSPAFRSRRGADSKIGE